MADKKPRHIVVSVEKRKKITANADKAHAKVVADKAERAQTGSRHKTRIGLPYGEHPSTSDVEYEQSEVEFMMALDKYKREKRRPFPTCREILGVLLSLGYRKVPGVKDDAASNGHAGSTETVGQDSVRSP
jgi:hypothetical protein